jgi:NAD(P)H-dependent flavin oxidoreductase YrpB (nitropropane dioxygenase family)
MWGERYPSFMDALMPLACLPVQIAGRNRMWRRMVIDAIHEDPAWKDIWGAGQGVGAVKSVVPVADLVARLRHEYDEARARLG